MREVLPKEGESIYPRRFDLLILNEAHNVAPSGSGNYAIDSQRTAAIRLLLEFRLTPPTAKLKGTVQILDAGEFDSACPKS